MSLDRFVVDTNVLISAALLAGSVPSRWVSHVLRNGRLLFCQATFDELHSRLWKPKFDRYVSIEDRKLLLRDLQGVADWLEPGPAVTPSACTDPDDEKFVQLVLAAQASARISARIGALVSGDKDLLALRRVATVPVLTPAQALQRFGAAA